MCVARADEKSVYKIFLLCTSKEQDCIMQKNSTEPGLLCSALHLQSYTWIFDGKFCPHLATCFKIMIFYIKNIIGQMILFIKYNNSVV